MEPTGNPFTDQDIRDILNIIRVSPVQYKLLFTSQERIAIRVERETDPVIDDFFDIIDDPRLEGVDVNGPASVSAVNYMRDKGLLTEARAEDILANRVPPYPVG